MFNILTKYHNYNNKISVKLLTSGLLLQTKNYICKSINKIMSDSPNAEEFYTKLKSQLKETTTWPSEYLYKFIIKTEASKIEKLESLFDNIGAIIQTTESKNGKYTSISINLIMKNPDTVIAKYIEVANTIDGVISL